MPSKAQLVIKARRAAVRHGVDPDIFQRLIQQESGYNPRARSPAGAIGIAQWLPSTAKAMGVDPWNVDSALDGAARYVKNGLDKYGSYTASLSTYNSGSPTGYKHIAETRNYVKSILGGSNPVVTKGNRRVPASVRQQLLALQPSSVADLPVQTGQLPELTQTTRPHVAVSAPFAPEVLQIAPRSPLGGSIEDKLAQIASQRQALPPAPQQSVVATRAGSFTLPGAQGGGTIKGSGGWGGSKGVVESLAHVSNLTPGSTKRTPRENAAVGGSPTSDHLTTNKSSYATDLIGDNLEAGARRVAKKLGIPNYQPNRIYTVTRGGYRIQLIFGAKVGHDDHVHVGAERVGRR